MKAVYKKEMVSYFTGFFGYLFIAFLLFFAGLYTTIYNLHDHVVNFEYVPGSMQFIYLIIIPILSMRVLAEERRQKTDQLLYSMPVSMAKVVVAKYLAMLTILAIPILIIALYPLLLGLYGHIYLPASYGALAAFFFLGAGLLAIGLFVSSLTDSQAIAAGGCFLVILVNYFIVSLSSYLSVEPYVSCVLLVVAAVILGLLIWHTTKNTAAGCMTCLVFIAFILGMYCFKKSWFQGLVPGLLRKSSLFQAYYGVVNGVFDLKSIAFLCSVSIFFVVLTVESMEKRRWNG